MMITDIALPVILGIILIGAATQRTITVMKGQVTLTFICSIMITFAYWANIGYVVDGDIIGYSSYSAGAMMVTCYMAYKNKFISTKSISINDSYSNIGGTCDGISICEDCITDCNTE
jgi:hypothetical protein